MKILESCKQKIENSIPRVWVDRRWAEAEWHHAITPCGGGLTIARDSAALQEARDGGTPQDLPACQMLRLFFLISTRIIYPRCQPVQPRVIL
jgi:hypothetical protein